MNNLFIFKNFNKNFKQYFIIINNNIFNLITNYNNYNKIVKTFKIGIKKIRLLKTFNNKTKITIYNKLNKNKEINIYLYYINESKNLYFRNKKRIIIKTFYIVLIYKKNQPRRIKIDLNKTMKNKLNINKLIIKINNINNILFKNNKLKNYLYTTKDYK